MAPSLCRLPLQTTIGAGKTTMCSLALGSGDWYVSLSFGAICTVAGTFTGAVGVDIGGVTFGVSQAITGTFALGQTTAGTRVLFPALAAPAAVTLWAQQTAGTGSLAATPPDTAMIAFLAGDDPILASILDAVTHEYQTQ